MKKINFSVVLGKSVEEWISQFSQLRSLVEMKETFWLNSKLKQCDKSFENTSLGIVDVLEAEATLKRFSPFISKVFPQTIPSHGIIESPLVDISQMKSELEREFRLKLPGRFMLKCDNLLPISGSIKARGGIYEVLYYAQSLAIANGLISVDDDYSLFDRENFRKFFSKYSISVGSTGNLGLSIGIMGARLGFSVYVHMSSDAKAWKKDLLRSKGVEVIEYDADYSKAVEEGRKEAKKDPNNYFVDDENSANLFLGYAVAALRLKNQLQEKDIIVDKTHPLFVYLPCGVGGGPGGVCFGLKLIFGDNVHCFFAEPTHSPCMLLGLMTGLNDKVCVQDFGIDNITAADGLAVGRASAFVGNIISEMISGIYTIEDKELFRLLKLLAESEDIWLEPSALAGVAGPIRLLNNSENLQYIQKLKNNSDLSNACHIAWATGGSMVPQTVMREYYNTQI